MYFEDIATRDLPQLPLDHPYFYMEDIIKKETPLKKKDYHDAEHERMLIKWGSKPEHTSKLTIRHDKDGVPFADRMYHIVLHLRYWKEEGMEDRMQYVERFEKESGYNLDDLTLPSPSAEGQGIY